MLGLNARTDNASIISTTNVRSLSGGEVKPGVLSVHAGANDKFDLLYYLALKNADIHLP